MKWYHYIAAFWAGMFLANFVPHFIHGISGDTFPSPFANPPGKGPSSPTVNVLWSMVNLLVGYILLKVSKTTTQNKIAMLVLFAGVVCMSLMLSIAFVDKIKA
jgi:thiamine transporter ThiT